MRDLTRDPFRPQETVVAADVPGGTAYLAGLDTEGQQRTLVCCVFSDAREALTQSRLAAASNPLTPAQTAVALMLAERHSNREIAQRLGSSLNTVRHHTEQVLQRLQIKRRTEVGPALQRWVTRALHDSLERCA